MRRSQYLGTEVHSLHYGTESGSRFLGSYENPDNPPMQQMKSAIESGHRTVAETLRRQAEIDDAQRAMADVAIAEFTVPRPTSGRER